MKIQAKNFDRIWWANVLVVAVAVYLIDTRHDLRAGLGLMIIPATASILLAFIIERKEATPDIDSVAASAVAAVEEMSTAATQNLADIHISPNGEKVSTSAFLDWHSEMSRRFKHDQTLEHEFLANLHKNQLNSVTVQWRKASTNAPSKRRDVLREAAELAFRYRGSGVAVRVSDENEIGFCASDEVHSWQSANLQVEPRILPMSASFEAVSSPSASDYVN